MDKLAAMEAFALVVETGSFTKAADLLALPKARVSQRVSDLERHLHVRLLHRTTRSLRLTEDGKVYYAKCQEILRDIEALENTLKVANTEPKGKLRVEALVSVARWILAPHLHDFQTRYPDIAIQLGASDRVSHLLEDGIDCAFRGGPLEDSSHIGIHLADVQFGLYAAPNYLQKAGVPKHPKELSAHHRLSWFAGQRHPLAWELYSDTDVFNVPHNAGLQFDDPDIAITSCISGAGICPGSPFAVRTFIQTGALIPVLPLWSFKARPIHILYPTNKHLSKRVRCFVDWSRELIQGNPNIPMSPSELAKTLSENASS